MTTKPARSTSPPKAIQAVETRLCSGVPGRKHRLTNRSEGNRLVTFCTFCEASWAQLDMEARR